METFLSATASQIYHKHEDLRKIRIVLPNRRAGLFFTKSLASLVTKATWMPEILTIEDVFYSHAGRRPSDQLTLLFELYKVYQNIHPQPESFDRFYYWGELILRDFNDIDHFLVDAKKLYVYLKDIKEMSSDYSFLTTEQIELIAAFWKDFKVREKDHQDKFLRFWELLGPLYEAYKSSLQVSGLAYGGMLYRQVAESIQDIAPPTHHYIYVGFNAFTLTEEILIKHYVSDFSSEIYWDIDQYYIANKAQEAGLFFRDYIKDPIFGPTFPTDIPAHIQSTKAKIQVHAIPLRVNQANLVASLLKEIQPSEPLEETVVIMPDENMLFPIMHHLPDNINQVNVTMGYPVRNAPVYSFLESLLSLQKYAVMKEDRWYFYHKPVKALLGSVYLRMANKAFSEDLIQQIESQNKVYIGAHELAAGGDFFALVFKSLRADDLFDYLEAVILALGELISKDKLQRTYLFQCFKQLNRLKDLFAKQHELKVNMDFFIRLFRQVFKEVRLPFEGEPLHGLQLMGVLESRNLDFKRVIICQMNEASFPPSVSLSSMIPFNLRKAFGLPVQEQNDSIYAYTFYRLLHRAKEVHLIYTTEAEQGKAGEKSRYIQQLQLESGLPITEQVIHVPVSLESTPEITIAKSPDVLARMQKWLKSDGKVLKRLSPSALNVYLDCRLKFYFQYVAEIKEKEEVQEDIDAAVFGNLAHYSLEFLYNGFMKRKGRSHVTKEDIAELKDWVDPSVELAIRAHYQLAEEDKVQESGLLSIVRDILRKYINRLLEVDASTAPFDIISLERAERYLADLSTEIGEVGFTGIIDRVDRVGEVVRLIDYKSGKDTKKFKSIESLFDRTIKDRNKAAMQTMLYGWLYQSKFPDNQLALKPAIFNLKEIFEEDFIPYLEMKEDKISEEVDAYQDYQANFEQHFRGLVEEMFGSEHAFDQTDDVNKCSYCPYKEICGR